MHEPWKLLCKTPAGTSLTIIKNNTKPMEPTTCGLIALAVLALLCGMRRRRTGVGEANRKGAKDAEWKMMRELEARREWE